MRELTDSANKWAEKQTTEQSSTKYFKLREGEFRIEQFLKEK
jgi:hypothetical protein